MKPEAFEQIIEQGTQERLEVSRERRKGYANDGDCLANFKQMAALCVENGLIPADCAMAKPDGSGIAMFFVIHKLSRRINLMKKGLDLHESKHDTDLDMHNYIDLGYACEVDFFERNGGPESTN